MGGQKRESLRSVGAFFEKFSILMAKRESKLTSKLTFLESFLILNLVAIKLKFVNFD